MASTPCPRSRLARLWRFIRAAVVFVFVCWHLFFLLFRNPLDLWWRDVESWAKERSWWARAEPFYEPVDRVTRRYGNLAAVQQGWSMFTPPLARSAPFLTARLDFTDGSQAFVFSENEPDPTRFLRLGGWRQRKLEDYMVHTSPSDLPGNQELPLFEAYARWCARTWREAHADDPRELAKVVLLSRSFDFPEPGHDPSRFKPPSVSVIGTFGPDGKLRDVRDPE
jgi:hypothetical protein